MSDGRTAVVERMVAAAMELIDERGEAGLRVAEVARQAGISTAKLYQEFEDREALVVAAQRERFERAFDESIDTFRGLVSNSTTSEQFRDLALGVLSRDWAEQRREARAARFSVIGAALTRPTLLEAVNARQLLQLEQVTEIIVDARRHGFVAGDTDARTVAAWVLSSILGRYLVEMGSQAVDVDRWDAIARESLRVVLFGAPVDRTALDAEPAARVQTTDADAPSSDGDDVTPLRVPQARNATAERILAWAIDQIETRGEAGLRVGDLEPAEGISPTSIYLHFGSRDGLVQAAQFARLAQSIEPLVTAWNESMSGLSDADAVASAVRQMIGLLTGPDLRSLRRQWLSVLASTHGRPALTAEVIDRLDQCYRTAAPGIDTASVAGGSPVRPDAPAIVAWVAGMMVGRAVLELVAVPIDFDRWDAFTTTALLAMMGLPDADTAPVMLSR